LFKRFGYPKLVYEDEKAMIDCLDVDKDGKVSITDLREIFKFFKE